LSTAREALTNLALFLLVILGAIALDGILHLLGRPEWGRYFGYLGTALIVLSFLHSARKRGRFQIGRAPFFLRLHEFLAWLGAMLIVVHGGIHFNGLLPWLAMLAMLVTVASGLTGKFLLRKSKAIVTERRKSLIEQGLEKEALEEKLYWDSLVISLMQKWRKVHLPITTTFGLLALLHVASVMIFWRW
jgi:hypothetical protein